MLAKSFPTFIVILIALVILQQYGVTTGIPLVDTQISKLGTFEWSEADKADSVQGEEPGWISAMLNHLKSWPAEADSEPHISHVPTANGAGKSSSKEGEGFVVQVGVFSDSANAERLSKTLETLNFESQITTLKRMRAVSVGPFDERLAAIEAAQRIQQVTGLSPLVRATSPQ